MAYSELIKSFHRIRPLMRSFYVYGFRHRQERDEKSARSYDNERRKIESWLGDYLKFEQDAEGKRIFLSVDSRAIDQNPLYQAFKAKSFTDKDIMLHFLLLDLLDTKDGLCMRDIMDLLEEYMEDFPYIDLPDESSVRKKLKEYENIGLVVKKKTGKKVLYYLAEDEVDAGNWADALTFFSEAAPLGVIGSYIREAHAEPETAAANASANNPANAPVNTSVNNPANNPETVPAMVPLNVLSNQKSAETQKSAENQNPAQAQNRAEVQNPAQAQNSDIVQNPAESHNFSEAQKSVPAQKPAEYPDPDYDSDDFIPYCDRTDFFRFKHHYILNALDSEILCDLFMAMGEGMTVILHKRLSDVEIIPLKIYISTQTGRQYVLGKTIQGFSFFRLDLIDSVKPGNPVEIEGEIEKELAKFQSKVWGTSIKDIHATEHLEFVVHAEPDEAFIVQRLQREKRCGTVTDLGDGNWKYAADVYDVQEMLPWVRTFIGRIVRLDTDNEEVKTRFYNELEVMFQMYGGDEDAVF